MINTYYILKLNYLYSLIYYFLSRLFFKNMEYKEKGLMDQKVRESNPNYNPYKNYSWTDNYYDLEACDMSADKETIKKVLYT